MKLEFSLVMFDNGVEMIKVINKSFFQRSVLNVAPDLLGKNLMRKKAGGELCKLKITEVEAYDGVSDLACHASKGRTDRTEVMFGEAGYFYVYLVYGMHYMLNIVTDRVGYPGAVLIRGVEGFDGPGKLTKALGVDKTFNGTKVCTDSGLWIEDSGVEIGDSQIIKGPRVGVDYSGPFWASKPYRFTLKTRSFN